MTSGFQTADSSVLESELEAETNFGGNQVLLHEMYNTVENRTEGTIGIPIGFGIPAPTLQWWSKYQTIVVKTHPKGAHIFTLFKDNMG